MNKTVLRPALFTKILKRRKIRARFANAGSGLSTNEGKEVTAFPIAGRIAGNSLQNG